VSSTQYGQSPYEVERNLSYGPETKLLTGGRTDGRSCQQLAFMCFFFDLYVAFYHVKYDKQDQQGKAAFNERNPHMTQQQELVARSPD
jgi:hypothetical protein